MVFKQIKSIKFSGAGGFKCAICGAPSGDKICVDCKKKMGC